MKDIFFLFKKFTRKQKRSIILFLFIVFIVSILSLLVPFVSGNFIDFLVNSNSENDLWKFCTIFALLSVLNIILGFFSNRIYTKATTNISFCMNRNIISHLQNSYQTYIHRENFAHLTQQIDVDTKSIVSFCLLFLQNIILNTFKFIFPLLMIFFYNLNVFLYY